MFGGDKGGWLLLAFLIVSAVPVGHAAVNTAAQEEGYHQPLYTDKIVSAGTSPALMLNQSAYEFDNGEAILTTDAGLTELFSASQPIVFQTSLTKINGEALFDDADQVAEFRGSSGNAFVRFNDTTQSTNVGQYDNAGDPYFFIDQEYVPGFGSLVIDDQGRVGLNTASPSAGLEVRGSTYISGGNPLYFDTGTGITQFVPTITGSGNNYSVPTTSAVTSDVDKKIEDVNLSAGTAIRIDGSNNIDVKRGSGIGVSSDQLYVGAGNGLSQNSGGLAVNSPTCTGSNEALRWNGNSFTCANVDDDTTYGPGEAVNIDGSNNIDVKRGSGISLSSDQLDVAGGQGLNQNNAGLEIDAPGPCDAGKEALQWNGSDFICSTVGGSSQDLGTPVDSPDGPTEISITGGLNASFVDTSAQQKCSGKYEYLAGDGTCRSDRVGGNLLFAGSAAASRSLLVQEDHTNVDGDEGDGNDHTVRCKADGNPIAITTLRVFGNDYLAGPLEAMCSKVYNTTFDRGLTSTVNSASGDEDDARCDGASSVSPEVLTEVEMTQAGSYDALNAKCVEVADSVQLGKEKWTRASDNNGPDGVQITRKCPDGHVMTAVEVNDGQDDNGELDQGVDIRCTELYSDENVVLEYMSEQAAGGCAEPGCDMEAYISNAGASNSFALDVKFTANYMATTLAGAGDCTTTTKNETRSVTVPADGDVIPQASFPQSAFGDDGTTCDLNTISTTVSNPNIGTKSCSASQYDLQNGPEYC